VSGAASPDKGSGTGLEKASTGLAAALKVVESSDRPVPAQALEVYRESSAAAKPGLAEWNEFKSSRLPELNHQLEGASLPALAAVPVENEIEESESQ
jgi:hypothetical protein